MNWNQTLTDVRDAYRNAKDPNAAITQANYLAMLGAFSTLVPLATISDAYDTDFRRNLPGGGLSGFDVVPLAKRISDAQVFAIANPVYPVTGEGIAENLLALLHLLPAGSENATLTRLQGTFQSILAGNL